MNTLKNREYTSQMVNPPIILTLGSEEQVILNKYMNYFTEIGFEIEHFGGKSVFHRQEGTSDRDAGQSVGGYVPGQSGYDL